jgi:hypothetical protein
MQQHKRGNGKRKPKRERRCNRQRQERLTVVQPRLNTVQSVEIPRLTLHYTDPITGNEDALYSLFYEQYRGYTIYSTERGPCCVHGKDGCLHIQGMYVSFPDIEQAKLMIKYFQAEGRSSQEAMNRYVPEQEYLCLNVRKPSYQQRQQRGRLTHHLQEVAR